MKIKVEPYDECWEIRFTDGDTFVGIVIEDDHAWCLFLNNVYKPAGTMRMPDEFFDMIKDEYKIKRPAVELPPIEEVRELPF